MNTNKKFLLNVAIISLSLGVISLSSCTVLETVETIKKIKHNYSDEELKAIYASSIRALNEVNYPLKERKVNNGYDEEFVFNVESFNELIFQKYIGNHSNFVYSPSNLYSSLHFLSLGSSKEANNILNNVLGSDNETRNVNYRKYFENNYFVNEGGISEIYNGFFINDSEKYVINHNYLNYLTSLYCEAYSLNIHDENNIESLVYNINKKVNETDLLKKDDLVITPDTAFILFNTFYFDHRWNTTYSTSSNYEDTFYSFNNEEKATYMQHAFMGPLKEYEKHIVFEDFLNNGYKVRYYVTKDRNDDISTCITKENYLEKLEYNENTINTITLSLPKFNFKNTINFNQALKDIVLSSLYMQLDNFNNCFTFLDNEPHYTFIENSIQATKVSFDNDGASFKSIQASTIGECTSAAPIGDHYYINLENPFIFEIRDEYDLPILFGLLNSTK